MAEFDGRKYEFVFATDEINDGVCLEAWQEEEPKELVLFAFRSWVDNTFTFTAHQENLPFALVEEFMQATRRNLLPPPEDDAEDGN